MKYCYQCGCTLSEDAVRCPVCGEPCGNAESDVGDISVDKLSAGFRTLCFFVPVIGFLWAFSMRKKNSFQTKRAISASVGGTLLWAAVISFVIAAKIAVTLP